MLERSGVAVGEERSTRASPIGDREARALLREVEEVWIARGRAVERLPARRVRPADLHGPTGRVRAPLLRRGPILLVGWHGGSLERLLSES